MRCTAAVQMRPRTGHSFLPIRVVHVLPRLVAVPCSAQQSASAAPAQDAQDAHLREQERLATGFTAQYQAAYTMAQLYANERPAPIDHSEHVARRKRRDAQELVEAARRRGKDEAYVRERLAQVEALVPDIINLHKMKAADWVQVLADVDAVAAKLICLKSVFPGASPLKIITKLPKLLLLKTEAVQHDAQKVRQVLSSLPNPDAIIEAVPDLVQPASLARALATIKAAMPNKQPLEVLQATPEVLFSLGGESDIGDSAEYGELSTKD